MENEESKRRGRVGLVSDGDTPSLPSGGGNSVCIRPLIGLERPFRLAGWIHPDGRLQQ
ncbi:MAG: hypothetical protein K0Q55_4223, partial [Verrucomicrobia bacterium]|jgi:hypothetical protein|nr:hypothetical protein [Verrucomicrobiota bacterium]